MNFIILAHAHFDVHGILNLAVGRGNDRVLSRETTVVDCVAELARPVGSVETLGTEALLSKTPPVGANQRSRFSRKSFVVQSFEAALLSLRWRAF